MTEGIKWEGCQDAIWRLIWGRSWVRNCWSLCALKHSVLLCCQISSLRRDSCNLLRWESFNWRHSWNERTEETTPSGAFPIPFHDNGHSSDVWNRSHPCLPWLLIFYRQRPTLNVWKPLKRHSRKHLKNNPYREHQNRRLVKASWEDLNRWERWLCSLHPWH